MGAVVRFIINLIIIAIIVVGLYIVGLMFHIVPLAYTPQVMFKDQYNAFKAKLKADPGKKNWYDFLDSMEKSYKPKDKNAAPAPTPGVEPAPATMPGTTPAPAMPGTEPAPAMPGAAPATTAPAPAPAMPGTAPATTAPAPAAPAASDSPVTKAQQSVQQYQNSINAEKKTLDNL